MKRLSILLLFLLIIQKGFSQSDSIPRTNKNHKNNIQTSLLGFAGYFALQYERELSNKFSVSLICNFNYPFSQLTSSPTINTNYYKTYMLHLQGRFYFDKNPSYNNGLYTSLDLGYLYKNQYNVNSPSTGYSDTRYGFIAGGIGYQRIIKKRLVIDLGASFLVGINGKQKSISSNYEWTDMNGTLINIPIILNIGYAF